MNSAEYNEQTVEKIVLSIPADTLKTLQDLAGNEGITVKQYILELIDERVKRAGSVIPAERLSAIMRKDSELSRRIREAQTRFDQLTKENAEATVQLIDAKLSDQTAYAARIQTEVFPKIAAEKNRILNEIRNLIRQDEAEEQQN